MEEIPEYSGIRREPWWPFLPLAVMAWLRCDAMRFLEGGRKGMESTAKLVTYDHEERACGE